MPLFSPRLLQKEYMVSPQQYIAGILAILVFLCYLQWKRIPSSKSREAPEPKGAWPVIGHLPLFISPQTLHRTFGNLADKYGPAFMIRLGIHKTLVVSSWEIAKECFTTNDNVFATRPNSTAVKIMGYNSTIFGFAAYGPNWREARKIAILELLSNSRLNLLKHVRVSEVSASIKELYQRWEGRSYGNNYVSVEMKRYFGNFTLNVISRLVAGKRYLGVHVNLEEDDEGRKFVKGIQDFFYLVGVFVLADALPCLDWLDFQGHQKAMKENAKVMDSILRRWLEEHRRGYAEGKAKREPDFIYFLMSIFDKDENLFDYDSDTAIKSLSLMIILGAADTTTVTLTWALSLLLNNPDILKKARHEIDTIVGHTRLLDEEDTEKLVYLQAIVKETLRLYPAAPLSAQHEAMEDCTVAGYHIKAGTRLITNIWKIQQDERVWSDPSEFRPERFLTSQARVDARGQYFEYIPFGSGRRSCPGMSFGIHVVQLALARLLQSFDFKTPSDASVDMTESPGLTNLKETPLQVLIAPRLSPNLY